MEKYHNIRAKKFGWERETVWFSFPAGMYTKEEVLAQFKTITKYKKNMCNGDSYPYTAYEYNGEEFYDIYYYGLESFSR